MKDRRKTMQDSGQRDEGQEENDAGQEESNAGWGFDRLSRAMFRYRAAVATLRSSAVFHGIFINLLISLFPYSKKSRDKMQNKNMVYLAE